MRTLAAVLALAILPAAAGSADEAVSPHGTIRLFDGKTLDAFYTWLVDTHREDPLRVFTVVDQVDGAPAVRISGERWGGLVTREAYRDYHLVVEFRWGPATWGERRNATRDSGVLVHCQGPDGNTAADGNGAWMRSVEAQVIEGGTGDFILVAGRPDERMSDIRLVTTVVRAGALIDPAAIYRAVGVEPVAVHDHRGPGG